MGFTFGQMFSRTTGQARLGLRPSKKSIKRVVEKVHELTVRARRRGLVAKQLPLYRFAWRQTDAAAIHEHNRTCRPRIARCARAVATAGCVHDGQGVVGRDRAIGQNADRLCAKRALDMDLVGGDIGRFGFGTVPITRAHWRGAASKIFGGQLVNLTLGAAAISCSRAGLPGARRRDRSGRNRAP